MTEELKQLGEDHEIWLKCFVATLSGATRRLFADLSTAVGGSQAAAAQRIGSFAVMIPIEFRQVLS
jgi:hypothetical protein